MRSNIRRIVMLVAAMAAGVMVVTTGLSAQDTRLVLATTAAPTTAPAAATPVKVEIDNFNFEPKELTVKVGETVMWINHDDVPHTATVKARSAVEVHIFEEAPQFLLSDPEIAFFIAQLLAQRLNAATTYLVDLKRQFADQNNHLEMVGEVLESLVHQQYEEVRPGSDRAPGL